METFHDTPLALVEGLLEGLVLVERRRQLPLAQLTWLVGRLGGEKTLDIRDYLTAYAVPEKPSAPKWVVADLRIAGEHGWAPQALVEAVHS